MSQRPQPPIGRFVISPRRRPNRIADLLSALPIESVLAPAARLAMASVFWLAGRTKVEGWLTVSDSAVTLFAEEYKLPLVAPERAAHLATYAEHALPVLLMLGLFARFSALALLGMTTVIQLLVYPQAWPTHLTWAVALVFLAWQPARNRAIVGAAKHPTCCPRRDYRTLLPVRPHATAAARRFWSGQCFFW